MKRFKIKFQLIWRIITGQYKHVVFMVLDEENFIEAVTQSCLNKGGIRKVNVGFFGMQEIQSLLTIKAVNSTISEGDLIAAEIENKINIDELLKTKHKQ